MIIACKIPTKTIRTINNRIEIQIFFATSDINPIILIMVF